MPLVLDTKLPAGCVACAAVAPNANAEFVGAEGVAPKAKPDPGAAPEGGPKPPALAPKPPVLAPKPPVLAPPMVAAGAADAPKVLADADSRPDPAAPVAVSEVCFPEPPRGNANICSVASGHTP
jgi:hypothetical protein